MKYPLRDYQKLGIEMMREEFRRGNNKVLLHLATGGGKGLIMSEIVDSAIKRGKKILVVIRRRELIFQTCNNFKKYHNISASIIMAGSKGYDPKNPCQVASIDTLKGRLEKPEYAYLKEFENILIDEAHDTNAPNYQNLFNYLGHHKYWTGCTATPFNINKKPLKFWQVAVKPIEPKELRDMGFLARSKTYAPFTIDTADISIKKGEFDSDELFKKVTENVVVGNIVDNYIKYGLDRPAILFAMNTAHSSMMAEAFRKRGIPSIHQEASHTSTERQDAIQDLVSGKIKVLCNVNIFSTGIDIPETIVGIFARPTMSEILWIQQVGRILRPHPTKEFAIILDHAGNTHRHGGPFAIRHASLECDFKPKEEKYETTACPQCYWITEGKVSVCPECGYAIAASREPSERSTAPEVDGVLIEVPDEDEHEIVAEHRRLSDLSKKLDWKKMAIWFKLHNRFGDEIYNHVKVPFWAKKILNNKEVQ